MSVDSVVTELFACMSFKPGEQPDWRRQTEIFAPNARLVRVNDDGVFGFDPRTFRANFEAMIRAGNISSFYEVELWRETHEFGDVAQVLSGYEIRTSRDGAMIARAVKSIQLYNDGQEWRISALLWRRDGERKLTPANAPTPQVRSCDRQTPPG
jgi:hypothetical protein